MNETTPSDPEIPQEDTVEVSEEALAAAAAAAKAESAESEKPREPDPEAPAEPAEGEPSPEEADSKPDLERELAETKDKLLRALADMENLRRRTQKEREDTAKYAVANFAREMLTVADNLRRAIEAIPEEARQTDELIKGVVEGVELTERDLQGAFERLGIVKIDPMGEKFTHEFHEALYEAPSEDAEPGTVIHVMEIGYVLHDRLLRPARVGVAKAPDAPAEEAAQISK